MNIKYEWYAKSLNKFNEELCGDVVKVINPQQEFIAVLSDGLGSGVKANILATLTSEILVTMMKENIDLMETINTVSETLPVCKNRGLAYSTFTLVQGMNDGKVKIINFDNPRPIVLIKGRVDQTSPSIKKIGKKKIQIWEYKLDPEDLIIIVSDGVVYAGLGETSNFGWGWDNVAKYVKDLITKWKKPRKIVEEISKKVIDYYNGVCKDDATVLGISLKEKINLVIFTGPPLDPRDDKEIVKEFLSFPGKKVICGGTTANIVSRVIKKEAKIDMSTARPDIPPMGKLEGIDLVTEGVITLSKTIELLKKSDFDESNLPIDKNAAVELAKILINADYIYIILGQSINPFYQNPDLPKNISLRRNIVENLVQLLTNHGKSVHVKYC